MADEQPRANLTKRKPLAKVRNGTTKTPQTLWEHFTFPLDLPFAPFFLLSASVPQGSARLAARHSCYLEIRFSQPGHMVTNLSE